MNHCLLKLDSKYWDQWENGASAESLLDGEGGNTGETASETKGDELVTSSSDGSGSISESAALQYKKAG